MLYALYNLLFCGFLANANRLPSFAAWMPYTSFLHYHFELVMSNELLDRDITVTRKWPPQPSGGGGGRHKPISGSMIVNDYLGYNAHWMDGCARIIPGGGSTASDAITACWLDLYVPLAWFAAAVLLCIVLLKYCVRDPH